MDNSKVPTNGIVWDRYAYVGFDPITRNDPNGHMMTQCDYGCTGDPNAYQFIKFVNVYQATPTEPIDASVPDEGGAPKFESSNLERAGETTGIANDQLKANQPSNYNVVTALSYTYKNGEFSNFSYIVSNNSSSNVYLRSVVFTYHDWKKDTNLPGGQCYGEFSCSILPTTSQWLGVAQPNSREFISLSHPDGWMGAILPPLSNDLVIQVTAKIELYTSQGMQSHLEDTSIYGSYWWGK